jgi:hypothetical protein
VTGLVETRAITCPHCWETIEVVVDLSEREQSYVEDCSVCCRPIAITVTAADGEIRELDAAPTE